MNFVNEIRRAETTNTIEKKLVWYEQKLTEIVKRLNSTPKEERVMILGVIVQELLLCTKMKPLERLGLIEHIKKSI